MTQAREASVNLGITMNIVLGCDNFFILVQHLHTV
jgi:hypothetical protein